MRARRTDKWIDGKCDSSINPKDGYAMSDCIDPREWKVLEYIVPILYLEKLGRVTKEIGNTIFGVLAREYKVGQIIQEVVGHLVANLEKRKASFITPYLFHLYYRNKCMRREEMKEVEVAWECLEYGVGPDTPPDEEEAKSKLVGSEEKWKLLSPNSRMKFIFQSPKEKSPIRTPDWRDMSILDLDVEPFLRVQQELDRVQNRFSKMEVVIRGASKLLSYYKAGNIVKELKKLKEKDTASLEAANIKLQLEVDQLKVALALKEDEVKDLKAQKMEALKEIREIVGHLGNTLNKAKLFDDYINKEVKITLLKVIVILYSFHKKVEAALGEIRKLVPESVGESSRPPLPPQKETPHKEKPLEEVKTLLS